MLGRLVSRWAHQRSRFESHWRLKAGSFEAIMPLPASFPYLVHPKAINTLFIKVPQKRRRLPPLQVSDLFEKAGLPAWGAD
jgi:hypothetical protein